MKIKFDEKRVSKRLMRLLQRRRIEKTAKLKLQDNLQPLREYQ